MREYLDLEFRDIEPTLPFEYSLERIIDDFILLAVFVGNDFLPNLPDLHIHENGLERLFDVYKTVLPRLSEFWFLTLVDWLLSPRHRRVY
jgi:5'-3' exoribonuclease 1